MVRSTLLSFQHSKCRRYKSWKCWESNPGLLGEKRECYQCAMPSSTQSNLSLNVLLVEAWPGWAQKTLTNLFSVSVSALDGYGSTVERTGTGTGRVREKCLTGWLQTATGHLPFAPVNFWAGNILKHGWNGKKRYVPLTTVTYKEIGSFTVSLYINRFSPIITLKNRFLP